MKAIGGYFELELNPGPEYHLGAVRLNSGRNAFEYILRAKRVEKVFLPYYTCEVMFQPVARAGVACELYGIGENFEPMFDFGSMRPSDYLVYTNYFGLHEHVAKEISKVCQNLIVDNSQAFFTRPLKGVDTFYSPRKFFGLPDG
ncbi:MAG: hypothetical protein RBS57_21680, partial [Desulforhabdus sp.]|nr:hypothetical protein [Desulforhabdus sp.]